MSTDPWTTAILSGPCHYCGAYHVGVCPRIRSIEYDQYGCVKRVEFYDSTFVQPTTEEVGQQAKGKAS